MHVDINAYLVIIYLNIKKNWHCDTRNIESQVLKLLSRHVHNQKQINAKKIKINKILQLFLNHYNNESIY